MKILRTALLALPVALAAAFGAPVSAQSAAPTLKLDYGPGTCTFVTDGGLTIGGDEPGVVNATGTFGTGCPTGSATGTADLSLGASATSTTVDKSVTITWSAVADVCHYTGTSFPAALSGWPSSGDACVGATACAAGDTYTASFTSSGNYTFGVKCISGEHNGQPETSAAKTVTVAVSGGTPPPPSTSCVAPAGLTQQTTATLQSFNGYPTLDDVDVTKWSNVFGYGWSSGGEHYGWPGFAGGGSKIFVNKNQYISIPFTVPANAEQTGLDGTPYGYFATNNSSVNNGVVWSASISDECGDFVRPTEIDDPEYWCYASFNYSQSGLYWTVAPAARRKFSCNLVPGKTYYFNLIAAPMSDVTKSNCQGSSCSTNLQLLMTFKNGPLLP
ncbi:MAG TPA: hypothetical protein VFG73_09910 [Rhodanobacteraceae bacterium]|nr:hypothetical protein [Rhodanobacteraceae bacterium]